MLTVFLTFCLSVWAERPTAPRPGQYSLTTGGSFFQTKANYTSAGTSKDLPPGWDLKTLTGTFGLNFDLHRRLRLGAGFLYGQTTTNGLADNGLTLESRSNSGLSEGWVSATSWLSAGRFVIAPELNIVLPVFRPNTGDAFPAVGEGATRIRGASWVMLRMSGWQPFIYTGFEHRDGGRSSLIPYSLGAHLGSGPGWWLQGELRGVRSVGADKDTSARATRDSYFSRVNGGSFRFWPINPNFNEVAIESGWRWPEWNLGVGLAQTINGTNAADGLTVMFSIAFMGRLQSRIIETEIERDSGFQIDAEQYDEAVFKEPEPQPKIRKKVRTAPSPDKMLDETQKELEKL